MSPANKIFAALAFAGLLAALPVGGGVANDLKSAMPGPAPSPRRIVKITDGLVGARLHNGRGLVLDISVGAKPLTRLRNTRGLTLTLGPLPQAIQASAAAAGANASADWRAYGN